VSGEQVGRPSRRFAKHDTAALAANAAAVGCTHPLPLYLHSLELTFHRLQNLREGLITNPLDKWQKIR
jgi:hypothetical protein